MLVLTRKCRESVVIGGGNGFEHVMKITVLDISNGRVKLGFDADPVVPIHRSEIWKDFTPGIRPGPPGAVPADDAARRG